MYPSSCLIFPQVTIANTIGNEETGEGANTNSADLLFCVKATGAIKDAGFPGVSLWISNQQACLDNMLTLVKTMRTEKKDD